jgi:hypothetical protein
LSTRIAHLECDGLPAVAGLPPLSTPGRALPYQDPQGVGASVHPERSEGLRQKTAARSAFLSRRSSRELSLSPRSEGAQPLWSPGAGPPRACRRFLLPDAPCRIKIPRGSELQFILNAVKGSDKLRRTAPSFRGAVPASCRFRRSPMCGSLPALSLRFAGSILTGVWRTGILNYL